MNLMITDELNLTAKGIVWLLWIWVSIIRNLNETTNFDITVNNQKYVSQKPHNFNIFFKNKFTFSIIKTIGKSMVLKKRKLSL